MLRHEVQQAIDDLFAGRDRSDDAFVDLIEALQELQGRPTEGSRTLRLSAEEAGQVADQALAFIEPLTSPALTIVTLLGECRDPRASEPLMRLIEGHVQNTDRQGEFLVSTCAAALMNIGDYDIDRMRRARDQATSSSIIDALRRLASASLE